MFISFIRPPFHTSSYVYVPISHFIHLRNGVSITFLSVPRQTFNWTFLVFKPTLAVFICSGWGGRGSLGRSSACQASGEELVGEFSLSPRRRLISCLPCLATLGRIELRILILADVAWRGMGLFYRFNIFRSVIYKSFKIKVYEYFSKF